jgi:hypothetical protein
VLLGPGADDVVERDVLAVAAGRREPAGAPDDPRLVRDESLHPPARPPRRVGQELNAARRIESLRGIEEPDATLGLEVLARHTGVEELTGQPRHVTDARQGGSPGVAERRRAAASDAPLFAHVVPPREHGSI